MSTKRARARERGGPVGRCSRALLRVLITFGSAWAAYADPDGAISDEDTNDNRGDNEARGSHLPDRATNGKPI